MIRAAATMHPATGVARGRGLGRVGGAAARRPRTWRATMCRTVPRAVGLGVLLSVAVALSPVANQDDGAKSVPETADSTRGDPLAPAGAVHLLSGSYPLRAVGDADLIAVPAVTRDDASGLTPGGSGAAGGVTAHGRVPFELVAVLVLITAATLSDDSRIARPHHGDSSVVGRRSAHARS